MTQDNPNHHIADHPFLTHLITLMRDKNCSVSHFRKLIGDAYQLLLFKALRVTAPHAVEIEVTTPRDKTYKDFIYDTGDVVIVPILRAGLLPAAALHSYFPRASIAHIGIGRDEDGGPVHSYRLDFPEDITERFCIVVEPVVATGDTVRIALGILSKYRGNSLKRVLFLSLISHREAMLALASEFPDVQFVTAAVDDHVENGYLTPGIGDVGDRLYRTENKIRKTFSTKDIQEQNE